MKKSVIILAVAFAACMAACGGSNSESPSDSTCTPRSVDTVAAQDAAPAGVDLNVSPADEQEVKADEPAATEHQPAVETAAPAAPAGNAEATAADNEQ